MRVLVCGGRDYDDLNRFDEVILALSRERGPISEIIEGGATGADHMAKLWALNLEIPVKTFKADWGKHGKSAGPIRNQQMIDEGKPDLVLAFPGGRGTADMVRCAREAGIEVLEIKK